jgi:DNA topoisomerase I
MSRLQSGIFANSPTMGMVRWGSIWGQIRLLTVGFSNDCCYISRDERAKQTIAGLIAAAERAGRVCIASDPDRGGEVIGWHIAQLLKLKQPQRVVYQEITESAVKKAIASPRSLDMDLIEAGRCRDCLDKLVGYKGSPLIWRLNNGAKSFGRV